ncbi:DUF3850 domain-containing protein [Immundisolibacter sp.]
MKTHELKIWPRWFNDVVNGKKTYEVRKLDRDYLVGDYLKLNEFNQTRGELTGRSCTALITHILSSNDYVSHGYGILGIRLVSDIPFHERLKQIEEDVWLMSEDAQIKANFADLIQSVRNMDNMIQTDRFFRKHIYEVLERFMIGFDPRYKYELDKIIQKFDAKGKFDVTY